MPHKKGDSWWDSGAESSGSCPNGFASSSKPLFWYLDLSHFSFLTYRSKAKLEKSA